MKRLLLVFPLLASSCLLSRTMENEALSPAKIAQLQPGVTTAQQALDLLGAPNDVVQLHENSAWLYQYTKTKTAGVLLILVGLVNTDLRSDRLWLFFDKNGKLLHAGSTLAANKTSYAMPWSSTSADDIDDPTPGQR